jgi:hypothetical protein
VLQLGVDDSVSFVLSLNDFQGVRGHPHTYDRMCEFTTLKSSDVPHRDDGNIYSESLYPLYTVLRVSENVSDTEIRES